jgi:hypothetical protein
MATMTQPSDVQAGTPYSPVPLLWTWATAQVCGPGIVTICKTYPAASDIQRDEHYYPHFSDSWLKHSETYCNKDEEPFRLE